MAKRSRACEAFCVPSWTSNTSRELTFEDQVIAREESNHLFRGPHDDNHQSDSRNLTDKLVIDPNASAGTILPIATRMSSRLKAKMASTEPSPGHKLHRGKSPVEEDCGPTGIRAKADDHDPIVGPGESGLLPRTVTPIKPSSSGLKGSSGCQSSEPTNFGMYAGRVKANPLKHLANVLQSKIQPHHEHRNLLEVATEIHEEAENKHNTTLRRIYDVVNVLDAAGLVERINGNSAAKNAPEDVKEASESSPRPAVENSKVERRNRGKDSTDKRSARGSTIRWIPPETEEANEIAREALEMEKAASTERVQEKRRKLDALTEELRVKTALIEYNQNRRKSYYSHSSAKDTSTTPSAEPEEYQSSCLLFSLDVTSKTFAKSKNNEEIYESHPASASPSPQVQDMQGDSPTWAATWDSPPAPQVDIYGRADNDPSDRNFDHRERIPTTGTAGEPPQAKGLGLPFRLLHTHESNHVKIEFDPKEGEVYFGVDKAYRLLDQNELLALMFPEI